MQNKVTYEYSVIRLVPKVEREEFMNVGVILFSKRKKFLSMKFLVNTDRIQSFSNEVDLEMIQKYLQAWESVCEGGKNGGAIGEFEQSFRFRWLVANRSTIIQSSKTHPGLCNDPELMLEKLFEEFVL